MNLFGKKKKPSRKIDELCKPRKNAQWPPEITLPIPVSRAAQLYEVTPRTKYLSTPKYNFQRYFDRILPAKVPKSAQTTTPSGRTTKLSKAKPDLKDPKDRTLPAPVSKGAMKAVASPRTAQLAQPRTFLAYEANIKVNPYGVSPNALSGRPRGVPYPRD